MPATAIAAPTIRPSHAWPVDGATWVNLESAKLGSRNFVTASSMPGIWIRPPTTASTASVLIAIFIGHSRSAMK